MTIADMRKICKGFLARIPRDVLTISILITASLASFCLGYLAGKDAIGQGSEALSAGSLTPLVDSTGSLKAGQVVASKAGVRYYRPDCPGVDRIADKNKVWFASPELAEAQGYEPAGNCDGL